MTKRNKFYTIFTVISTVVLATGIFAATKPEIKMPEFIARAEETYSCNEINFGSNVGLANETRMDFLRYEYTTIGFNISTYAACGHNKLESGPIRLGGATTAGHMVIDLEDAQCTRAFIYCASLVGEGNCELTVNGTTQTIHTTEDEYDFSTAYLYEFDKTSSIDIKNNVHVGRCFISKIILRTYR